MAASPSAILSPALPISILSRASASASSIQLGVGTFTVNSGGADITITNLGLSAGQSYDLINYGAGAGSGFTTGTGTTVGDLTLTDPVFGFNVMGSLDVTGSAVELVTSGGSSPVTAYWTGSQGTTWTANNGTVANFSTDAAGATSVGAYPSSTTDVIFAATGATNLTNSLGQNFDIKGLTFLASDAGSNTIGAVNITDSSSSLTLEGDGLTDSNNNGVTLNPKTLIANTSQSWTNNSTGTLTVSAAVSATTNTTLTLANSSTGPTALNGLISNGTGTLSLTINSSGSGAIVLGAANTFTGTTTINSGTLQLGTNNAVQDSTVAINATNGLLFSGGVGTFNIAGLSGSANEALSATNSTLVAWNVGGTNASSTFAGGLTGGGSLIKSGTGTLTLSGNNSYTGSTAVSAGSLVLSGTNTITGPVAVNGGVLSLQSNGGLGSASSVTVTNGAALQLQGGISDTSGAPLTLNGSGISGNGALESVSGNNTYSGAITLGSAATIGSDTNTLILSNAGAITGAYAMTLTGAGNGTVNSNIGTGVGSLTMSGTGTWTLAGNNSYTGPTSVNSGTLILSGINTATGVTTLNGNFANVNTTLQLVGANALQDSSLTVNAYNPYPAAGTAVTSTLQLRGNGNTTFAMGTQNVNGIDTGISANISLTNQADTSTQLVIDVGASSGGSAGVMSLGTITWADTPVLGTTSIITATNSNGDGSKLSIGAIKSNNENIGYANDFYSNLLTLNSGIMTANGLSIGSFTQANNIDTTLTLGGAGNTTFTGAVGISGIYGVGLTLIDNQTGTVTLAGSDSFAGGAIFPNAGTLVLDNNNALAGTSAVTLGSTTSTSNNVSVLVGDANNLTGGLSVTQNFTAQNADTGTLALGGQNTSGTNTFSGNVTLGATANTGKSVTLLSAPGGVVAFTGNILQNGNSTAGVTAGNASYTGTVVLSGTNTYTGPTTISAGTLLVNGNDSAATGAVSVNGGATLGGTGTIGGAVTVAGGGTSAAEGSIYVSNSATQTLTINGGLTVGGTSAGQISNLDFATNGSNPTLIQLGTGTFTVNTGGADITVTGVGFGASQTYQLIDYGAGTGAGFGNGTGTTVDGLTLTDPSLGGGITGYLEVTGNEVELVTSGISAPGTAYWTGSQGTNWNSNNGVYGNFSTDSGGATGVQTVPGSTTDVYFAATGATNLSNSLGQNFDIKGLTFLATDASSNTIGAVNITDSTSTLTIEGDGITDSNGNGVNLSPKAVILKASQTWTSTASNYDPINSFADNAPVTGTATAGQTTTLTVQISGNEPVYLNGVISDGTSGGQLALNINSNYAAGVFLGAANTFTGATTVNSGYLSLLNANALQYSTVYLNSADANTNPLNFAGGTFTLGGLSGSHNLVLSYPDPTILQVGNNNANTTYSGILSGSGALTKVGTGTLTLSGNNSYSGLTIVNAGTLLINGNQSSATGVVIVNGGGTLGGTGIIGGSVQAGDTSPIQGTINLSNNAGGALTINGGLVVGGSSAGEFSNLNFATYGSSMSLIQLGTGTFRVNAGGADITVTGVGFGASQTYQLIDYGAGTGAGFGTGSGTTVDGLTLTDPSLGGGITGYLVVTGNEVELVTSGAPSPGTAYWTGSQGSTWKTTNAVVANFSTDAAGATSVGAYPGSTTDVYFAATSATNLSNSLGQNFDIKGLTFLAQDASSNIIGAVNITDSSSSLTLEGDGIADSNNNGVTLNPTTLIANASQTWTNNSTGTLAISAPVIGTATTGNTTTLTVANANTGPTYLNGVIGDGSDGGQLALNVNSTGTGAVILGAANTFTGSTTISAGTLTIGSAGSLGSGSYGGAISNSGSFIYSGSSAQTLSGAISGTGALVQSGTGTLTLSNATNSFGGGVTVSSGTLATTVAGALGSTTNSLSLSGGGILDLENTTQTAGAVSLGASTIQSTGGAGTLNTGVVTVTGASAISSGATVATGANAVNINSGGTLTLNGASSLTSTGTVAVNSGGSLVFGASSAISSGATVQGAGGTITMAGTTQTIGVLTLLASSGTTTLDLTGGGQLTASDSAGALSPGGATLDINDWQGTSTGGNAGYAVSLGTLLNSTDLANVDWSNVDYNGTLYGSLTGAQIVSGQLTPVSMAPVPEPSTVFGALCLLGLIGWRKRRQIGLVIVIAGKNPGVGT
jgi:autotransporter-associated beta strand protein